MIKGVAHIIFLFFSNLIALAIAAKFVPGFTISFEPIVFAQITAVFTLINIFIKPIIKIVLTPVLILTFGLGIIFVNAIEFHEPNCIFFLLYNQYF